MRLSFCRYAVAIGLGLLAAAGASAAERTVKVDSRAMPWNPGINRRLPFGLNDGRSPVILFGMRLIPGTMVKFRATGSTTTVGGGGPIGPSGEADFIAGGRLAGSGTSFPGAYLTNSAEPPRLNELVGAFIDPDGTIVGQPFAIGEKAEILVPEGASAISLGINDDRFSDNSGALEVTVSTREGRVDVE